MRPELAARLLDGQARIGTEPLGKMLPTVEQCQRALRDAGASAGAVVAIEEGSASDFFTTVLAVWLLDCIPLPYRSLPQAPLLQSAFVFPLSKEVRPPTVPVAVPGLGSTAVLHTTSGTTGTPKLAQRSVASVLTEATGYHHALSLGHDDRVLVPVPLTHSYGWGIAFSALMAGCDLDSSPAIHARRTADRAMRATVVGVTAPLARVLTEVPGAPPDTGPRVVMVGASRVTTTLDDGFAARFGLRLSRNYGSSETGATFAGDAGLPEGAIGEPMQGVAILQPDHGQEGELRLRLDAPFEGYAGETAEPMSVWPTSDLVRRDEAGVVRFIARLRPMMRLNDRAVDVAGVEKVLRAVSGVEEVFPVVLPRGRSETEDLYVVVAGSSVNPEQIESYRARLPDGTRSARIIYRASLPLSPNGKVDTTQVISLVRAERDKQ